MRTGNGMQYRRDGEAVPPLAGTLLNVSTLARFVMLRQMSLIPIYKFAEKQRNL